MFDPELTGYSTLRASRSVPAQLDQAPKPNERAVEIGSLTALAYLQAYQAFQKPFPQVSRLEAVEVDTEPAST